MGGWAAVAIRSSDEQVVCHRRRIETTPALLLHPSMLTGDSSYLDRYLSNAEECILCPQDYGLVVVDHAGRQMLAMQCYTDYRQVVPSRLETVDGSDDMAFAETALALLQAGRLGLSRRDRHSNQSGGWDRWRTSCIELQPSLAHVAQLARAAERQHADNYQAECEWRNVEEETEYEFTVSLAPLVYRSFPETAEGAAAFLECLQHEGFALDEASRQGWAQWMQQEPTDIKSLRSP